MKKLLLRGASLVLSLLFAATTAFAATPEADPTSTPTSTPSDVSTADPPQQVISSIEVFDGIWEGHFPVYIDDKVFYRDAVTMDIDSMRDQPLLMQVRSIGEGVYIPPSTWSASAGTLIFDLYEGDWYSLANLTMQKDKSLSGKYYQGTKEAVITFRRVSNLPTPKEELNTQFMWDEKTGDQWLEELKKYPDYSSGGTSIPFTYTLQEWEKSQPLMDVYGLNALMDGRSDIELMESILNLVCDNFKHDGTVPIPQKMDPLSVIAYHNEMGGIECRGLSVILSEMLRSCGIEAKSIMCIPSVEPSECHVLVHAYSKSLNQWVLLDPTYRLMLKNQEGQLMNLPMLRQALINDDRVFASKNAGYNGAPLYMPYYRAYMSKNTFRFSSATQFYFGGERFASTDAKVEADIDAGSLFSSSSTPVGTVAFRAPKNPQHMLVPTVYKVPYYYSREEKVTTNPDSFWALPKQK